ncbi:RmlC-like cupin domain-containing protein [Suillus clintonianus]|uniref:RmlC-like cupin domain-containing protein n=1 Tax=Suillus clintonianus TaxID=1904413 RepID=UPI001B866034|nr:RmlC-like cupin domain-containing protein [Suillus clintonianus]KAG2114539.1 RmlC-like cupin domain-containing protein [Suillus clintonianus]
MTEQVFRLIPATQSYPWGKKGSNSLVAQLADGAGIPDFKIDESKPYAELWMGTHPNAPTRVLSTGHLLSEHLVAHPELVGESVIKRFGLENGQLPFLFKVLSFDKALPVQIHPDKQTAEHIHLENPRAYVDSNHKPEMVLALSEFTALCGFLPTFQVSEFLSVVPEFASLFPSDIVQNLKSVARSPDESERKTALKELLSSYANVDNEKASVQLKLLVERYRAGQESDEEKTVKSLVLQLHDMYQDDSGVFCAFILNYFNLKPGHAFSVATGEPHAYITGDIIECMATSDNTIAVAFSPPEQRDVQNFLSNVQYNPTPGKTFIQPTMFTRGSTHTNGSLLYNPPIYELAVMQVIAAKGGTESHHKLRGPSIAVVIEGEGTVVWAEGAKRLGVKKGQVVFIAAGTEVKFSAFETSFKLYRAFVEVG